MANDTLSPTLYAEGEPQQPSTPAFTDIMPPMRSVGSFGDPEQAPVVATPAQPDGAYSIAQPYLLPPYRPMASVPDYPLMGVYSQLPTTSATINYPSLFTPGYMVWQGAWQDGFQYNVDDVVYQNVSTYIAIQANNNNPPDENVGTYWQLVGENFNYRGQWAPNPLLNVQNAHASGGSQTFTCAYGSGVTAGNWLYAVYQAFYTSGTTSNVPSVTDSLGNSWVQLGSTIIAQGNGGGNVIQQAIFGCQASFSGSNTVTFTGTSGTSISEAQGNVFEYGELLVGGFGTPSFATASIFTGGIGQAVTIASEGAVLISASFGNFHNGATIGFDPAYFTKQNSNGNTGSGNQLVTGGGYNAAGTTLYGVTSSSPLSSVGATAHIVPLMLPTVYVTEYNPFDVVLYLGSTYVCIYPTNSDPVAGLGTSWVLLARGAGYSVAQTANYTAVATDSGTQQNFTISGATTFKLPATPPDPGWFIWAMNNPNSTAALSVSPNGLNLDGSSSSYTLSAGSGILIFTDGANYFTQRSASLNAAGVNAQTGTTYTFLASDRGQLVTFSNAAAIAATLPVASTSGFGTTWYCDAQNIGAVGQGWVTITPTTSTIDGAATLVIQAGAGVRIFSDGTNYFTQRGVAALTLDNLDDTSLPRTAQYFRPAQFTTDVCVDNASFQASAYMVNGAPPGWYNASVANGAATYNTSTPYIGGQCLQITGKNGADIANCRVITVMPGETYEVSGWIKTDGVCTGQIELIYTDYPISTAGTIIASSSSASWTYVSNTGTIPTTTGAHGFVLGIIACTLGSGSPGSVANFQNVRLHRIFGASGTYSSPGMVPDPGQSAGTTRFLREDASWQVPPPAATTFDLIGSGTNTSAAMVLGSGSSLTISGTGTNNATAVDGVTVTGTPTAGQALIATSSSAANWSSVGGTSSIPLQRLATWTVSTASQSNWSTLGDTTTAYGTAGGSGGSAFIGVTPANSTTPSGWLGLKFYTFGTNTLFQTLAGLSRTTNVRCWIGLTSATGATMGGSAAPAASSYACFRYDTSASDAAWQCCTSDATSQTVVSSGVAVNTLVTQNFAIQCATGSSDINFYINGALVATIATHLPASGTAMAGILNITTLVTPFTAQLVASRVTVQSDY